MKKLKICVYAISKNEEKFVDTWVNSMSEADEIYVLDTGSTDKTVQLLKKRNVKVFEKEIIPWRFDVARNESLKLVPDDTDICVCTDLDEVFIKGWRKTLEENYKEGYRVNYTYNWYINDKGIPEVTFLLNNIHPKKDYYWLHPVHEVLTKKTEEKVQTLESIILNHYPDRTKSRSSYLPLLEMSVKEDPEDDRNMHYLGREYMYYRMWDKSIETLKKHLELKTSTWNLERAASMRFIGRCYTALNNIEEAEKWYKLAIEESPLLRDGYVELAMLYNKEKRYLESINYLIKALTIKEKDKIYINETFSWDNTIDDLLSLNYYYLGIYNLSLYHINKALEYNKDDDRLIKNKKLIEKEIIKL